MPDSPDASHLHRLREIEEAAAFAERHAEQLSQQIIEVWQRIDALTNRLGQMESRLSEMHQTITEQDSSASPTPPTDSETDDPGLPPGPNHHLRADRPPHWDGKH